MTASRSVFTSSARNAAEEAPAGPSPDGRAHPATAPTCPTGSPNRPASTCTAHTPHQSSRSNHVAPVSGVDDAVGVFRMPQLQVAASLPLPARARVQGLPVGLSHRLTVRRSKWRSCAATWRLPSHGARITDSLTHKRHPAESRPDSPFVDEHVNRDARRKKRDDGGMCPALVSVGAPQRPWHGPSLSEGRSIDV